MNLLVDTHVLIWMSSQPNRLSEHSVEVLENEANTVSASLLSFWEIAIKISIGKLDLKPNWIQLLQTFMRNNSVSSLPLRLEHCATLAALPFHHRDPFDRMLVAQAKSESLSLVSQDVVLSRYDVDVVW